MTREECEIKLMNIWKELCAVYKEYNPKGHYITANAFMDSETLNEGSNFYFAISNSYYPGGSDESSPISVMNIDGEITHFKGKGN